MRKRVETSDFPPGRGGQDLAYKSLAFICCGAARKGGITSESTAIAQVVLEVRDVSLGGTSLSQGKSVRSLWQEGKNKMCSKKLVNTVSDWGNAEKVIEM